MMSRPRPHFIRSGITNTAGVNVYPPVSGSVSYNYASLTNTAGNP